jgi:hypothetical protein
MSERQLGLALAATGRAVSLQELGAWRKDGLLPPMASTGLGAGKGKSYYWQDENILARAQTVCDAMRRHGRTDQTLVTLFLSGFAVPLPQLRRAWRNRARLRKPPAVQIVRQSPDVGALTDLGADGLLLQAVLCVGAAVETENSSQRTSVTALLDRALSKLGLARPGANDSGLADQLWHLLGIIGAMLDASELMRGASDDELHAAQHYLGVAMAFLRDCSDPSQPIIETLGPQLFLFFLTLLHSGQGRTLDRLKAYVEGTGWQVAPPAQGLSLTA